jgi:hypothetical protein
MDGLAFLFGVDRMARGKDETVRVALGDQLAGDAMPRHDDCVLIAKDAGLRRKFMIGKMLLGGMQGAVNRGVVLVRADFQHALNMKARITPDEGIVLEGHG